MKAGNEVRVGVVVILALAVLLGGYFALSGAGWGAQKYYLKLDGAALISEGSDVRLQGVKVGTVQNVALDEQTQQPLLTLAIQSNNPPFSLYRSYKYSVRSNGIIGENYVDIQGEKPKPGDATYTANDPSQIIPGTSGGGLLDVGGAADQLTKDVSETLKSMNITLDRLNNGVLSNENQLKIAKALDGVAKLTANASKSFGANGVKVGLGDPQAQRALNATFINAALAANEAALAARDVRKLTNAAGGVLQQSSGVIGEAGGVLRDNRKQLNTLLVNLDRTTRNAADTVESVNFIIKQSNLEKSAKEISGSLERAAKNVEDTTASFKGLSDEQTQKDLRATLTALRESSEALRDTANSIKSFVADDNSQSQIKGTLSTLNTTASTLAQTSENLRDATAGIKNIFGDPKVQDDVKAIPAELRRTLEATTSTAERLNNLLGGRRRSRDAAQTGNAEGTGNAGENGRQGALLGGFDFTARRLDKGEDKIFGDIGFQTELFGGPFRIGLDEIGEGTHFTLQSGKFLGDNAAIRYGLYRSKLGVGADYRTGRFSLEANLYDPNERSWNVYGGVRLTRGLELLLGREKRGSVRSNAIAVRLRP
jgi:phospholipid/cholesterol/gamma-HCH transport system substrate-binding protein